MTDRLRLEKQLARKRMKEALSGVTPAERSAWSARITRHVTELSEWKASSTVLAFLSMDGEVDTAGMIQRALSDGKTVGVPRMREHYIEFHKIESIDGPWEPHPFGVREPPAGLPVIDPCATGAGEVFVVTPGLCFDLEGGRLGFGKGYYDRLIGRCRDEKEPGIFFAAVCFSVQIIYRVPAGEHDFRVDAIVTERGVAARPPRLPSSLK
ncbi:MAG: 5-formyltetrahydrofolate cyclo-ligase [Spirochaetales bacterium]|nr:5-formyltetrahydrofolate cyclo-ligase [Spirochaetales bacterium]